MVVRFVFYICFHSPIDKLGYVCYNIIQGDVINIVDGGCNHVATYHYDAWGNVLRITDNSGNEISLTADHIANKNPFRFRGYYYDSETGLYYLNARYYDPETGRFISKDDVDYLEPDSVNGYNLYAYCYNNPVMYSDPSGHWIVLALIVAAALIVTGCAMIYSEVTEEPIVLDLSLANNAKVGISLIIDPKSRTMDLYCHVGYTFGLNTGPSYSVGKAYNYSGPGSSEGPFIYGGGGYYLGIDGSLDPKKNYNPSTASITFSSSGSIYGGIDNYYSLFSFNY